MAAAEMYDYLPTVTPDYDYTLNIAPTSMLVEEGNRKQELIQFDDNNDKVITIGSTPRFKVTLQWQHLTSDDSGTILDLYFDSSKANGMAKTFKWAHPTDGHTYVVRFAEPLRRSYKAGFVGRSSIEQIVLNVVGKV